jgi:hypothetical protein
MTDRSDRFLAKKYKCVEAASQYSEDVSDFLSQMTAIARCETVEDLQRLGYGVT